MGTARSVGGQENGSPKVDPARSRSSILILLSRAATIHPVQIAEATLRDPAIEKINTVKGLSGLWHSTGNFASTIRPGALLLLRSLNERILPLLRARKAIEPSRHMRRRNGNSETFHWDLTDAATTTASLFEGSSTVY